MTLEDQVISVEYAIKLKELGIRQESIFVWQQIDDKSYAIKFIPFTAVAHEFNREIIKIYPAYTASELIKLLPNYIDTDTNHPFNRFRFDMQLSCVVCQEDVLRTYLINYNCDTFDVTYNTCQFPDRLFTHVMWDTSLCNALAKTLIEFINKGYVKL